MEDNAVKTFDLGFGCLGNGTTVWDRNQDTGNDYKTVAHIAAYGGVKLYDQRLKTSPEALRRIIDMAGRQQLDFYHWWFGQSYATQYSLFYESMTLRQQLAERDDWPKEKSAEWMYRKYITFACLNQGYTMPAELETR